MSTIIPTGTLRRLIPIIFPMLTGALATLALNQVVKYFRAIMTTMKLMTATTAKRIRESGSMAGNLFGRTLLGKINHHQELGGNLRRFYTFFGL